MKRVLLIGCLLLPLIFTKDVKANTEYEMLCKVVMSEAEGEPLEGKILVADTILNRVEDSEFPDTIKEVIEQPNQYYISDKEPNEEVREAVKQSMQSVSNNEVLYFRTNKYHSFGQPICKVGLHYFSGR